MKKSYFLNFSLVSISCIISACSSVPYENKFEAFEISQVSCDIQPENSMLAGIDFYVQKEKSDKILENNTGISDDIPLFSIFSSTAYFHNGNRGTKESPLIQYSSLGNRDYVGSYEITSTNESNKYKAFVNQASYGFLYKAWVSEDDSIVNFEISNKELEEMKNIEIQKLSVSSPTISSVLFSGSSKFGELSHHDVSATYNDYDKLFISGSLNNNKNHSLSYDILACPKYMPKDTEIVKD